MLEYKKYLNVNSIAFSVVLTVACLMPVGSNLSLYASSNNDNDGGGSSERSREQNDGGFSQGYDDGEENARQDYINGENFHDSCSFDHSNSYCLGYKSGYRVGWTAAQLLH